MELIAQSTQDAVSAVSRNRPTVFEAECIQFFEEVVHLLGVQRSIGQIYGLLFASSVPLSFTDIVDILKISKGSASQGLRLLRELGAVRSTGGKQDRRELFEPELGLRNLVGGILRDRIEPLVGRGRQRMVQIRESAQGIDDPVARKFALTRIKQLETWRGQMGLLLPILMTIVGRRTASK